MWKLNCFLNSCLRPAVSNCCRNSNNLLYSFQKKMQYLTCWSFAFLLKCLMREKLFRVFLNGLKTNTQESKFHEELATPQNIKPIPRATTPKAKQMELVFHSSFCLQSFLGKPHFPPGQSYMFIKQLLFLWAHMFKCVPSLGTASGNFEV